MQPQSHPYLLALLSLILLSFARVDGADSSLMSSYPKSEQERVLIGELKGISIRGNEPKKPGISLSGAQNKIEWFQLEIPGHPNQLCDQLEAFIGHPVTLSTLGKIRRVIADYWAGHHRPFVLIKVPEQDVTQGILQLKILESELGQLKVEGNDWTKTQNIKKYFQIQPGEPIDQSRLIQNVSFINRNPFRRVDLVFVPGQNEGTTDVVISTKDRRPVRMYSGTDNTGVEPSGANRWYAGLNWGNTFGLDHIFSYQYTASYNNSLFQAHTAEYTALLSWGHVLNFYGGYSEVHPHVLAPIKRNDGWSMQTSLRYVAPLKIYRYLEHEMTVGGDFKRSNNTFEFTEVFPRFGNNVNLTQLVVGYSGNYERNALRLDFSANLYWSPGKWIDDQTNENYASLRPGAVNHWVYLRGSLAYLQKLPKAFSLFLLTSGQISSQPLLPSEQFGLGGFDTVRGYEQREVNKDNAILTRLEARTPGLEIGKKINPSWKISDGLQFLIFMDYGWGVNHKTIPGSGKADYLLGAGPGFRYTIEPYLTMRLDWGIRLHNKKSFEGEWDKIHFNLTASY